MKRLTKVTTYCIAIILLNLTYHTYFNNVSIWISILPVFLICWYLLKFIDWNYDSKYNVFTQDLLNVHYQTLIRIKKAVYRISFEDPEVGDLVLDRKDGTYGICDMKKGRKISISDNGVAEVAIPIERVYKLKLKL